MTMKKSPLARVTETFKDKKSLIEAVKGLATDDLWLDSVRGVSLRLHTDNRAITLASGSDTVTVKFGWDDFGWEEEEEETPVE